MSHIVRVSFTHSGGSPAGFRLPTSHPPTFQPSQPNLTPHPRGIWLKGQSVLDHLFFSADICHCKKDFYSSHKVSIIELNQMFSTLFHFRMYLLPSRRIWLYIDIFLVEVEIEAEAISYNDSFINHTTYLHLVFFYDQTSASHQPKFL